MASGGIILNNKVDIGVYNNKRFPIIGFVMTIKKTLNMNRGKTEFQTNGMIILFHISIGLLLSIIVYYLDEGFNYMFQIWSITISLMTFTIGYRLGSKINNKN
jgi:hypothetical protein